MRKDREEVRLEREQLRKDREEFDKESAFKEQIVTKRLKIDVKKAWYHRGPSEISHRAGTSFG